VVKYALRSIKAIDLKRHSVSSLKKAMTKIHEASYVRDRKGRRMRQKTLAQSIGDNLRSTPNEGTTRRLPAGRVDLKTHINVQ